MNGRPADLAETLATHATFLRRVARGLLRGDADADDLCQETWLAYVEGPPVEPHGVRGWLAGTARNRARMLFRGNARRERREAAVAQADGAPSVDDVLARERLHRRVVAAVLRLDETSRDVVLLRYYEDLPPRRIADRLGLPVETVRTRLKRARARLRDRLDEAHGGERRRWATALAPLAGIRLAGGAAVAAKTNLLVPLLLVLLLAGAAIVTFTGGVDPDDPGPAAAPPPPLPPDGSGDAIADAGAGAGADAAASIVEPDAPEGVLRCFVVAGKDEAPVAGVTVKAERQAGRLPDGMTAAEPAYRPRSGVSDEAGRVEIEGVPLGAWRLTAEHPDLGSGEAMAIARRDAPWAVLALAPPEEPKEETLRVRVVDPSGAPVPGAVVEAWATAEARATANAKGWAGFEGVGRGYVLLTATGKPGVARALFRPPTDWGFDSRAWALVWPDTERRQDLPPDGRFDLPLLPAGSMGGAAPPGTRVEIRALIDQGRPIVCRWSRDATAGPEGTWRIDGLPAGPYGVLVRAPGGKRPFTPVEEDRYGRTKMDLPFAEVEPGRHTEVVLDLVPGGRIRGRVERADGGGPVAGARVEISLPLGPGDYPERVTREGVPLWRFDSEPMPDDSRAPGNRWHLTTDEAGRYEAIGLPAGTEYRVRVVPPPDLAWDRRMDLEVRHGETKELLHRLEAAGTLEAVVPPFQSLGLRRAGENDIHASFITQRGGGAVTIPGLAAGRWEICSVHSDPKYRPLVLATFVIRAGETTRVDVLERGRAKAEITFRDRGVPVAGVRVRILGVPGTLLSDAHGRVSVRLSMWDRYSLSVRFRFPGADSLWVHRTYELGQPDGTWVWRYDIDAPSARVTFRATDAGRGPAERVRVSLHVGPTPPGGSVYRAQLTPRSTGPAGEIAWPPLPEGEYAWEAVFPNGTIRRGNFELAPGETREIEVAAEAVTSLRARILDARGEPAKGARVAVQLFRPGREEGEHRPARTEADDDGVIVVSGLPESRVRVQAFRGSREPWERGSVERAPPADVEVHPPTEATITLTLTERR